MGSLGGHYLGLDNAPTFHVDAVLGFIDQIGLAFLPADLGIGVMPVFKLLIAQLLIRPFAIKPAHRFIVVGINAGGLGQLFYIIPIGLFSVAHHQALERGVGFNDRAIDPQVTTFEQTTLFEGF